MTELVTRDHGIKNRMTPEGKVLGVAPVKGCGLYQAHWEGGGELPDVLKNKRFTQITLCDAEIKAYLSTKWDEWQAAQDKQAAADQRAANRARNEAKHGTKKTEPKGTATEA